MNPVAILAQSEGGNPLGLVILLLPIAALVFLMIVPQQRQKKKQAALVNALAVGDEVVTIGGLFGVINVVEGDVVHLEVDDDVVLRFARAAISRKVDESEPEPPASKRRVAASVKKKEDPQEDGSDLDGSEPLDPDEE